MDDLVWMNPREYLPGIYGDYLVIHKYYGLLKKEYEYEVVFYDNENTWWGNNVSYNNDQILAWTYLPLLPVFLEDKK